MPFLMVRVTNMVICYHDTDDGYEMGEKWMRPHVKTEEVCVQSGIASLAKSR